MPFMDVENVDRLRLSISNIPSQLGKIEKTGDVIGISIDFFSMEIAGRMACFEKAERTFFNNSRPHGVRDRLAFFKAAEFGNFDFHGSDTDDWMMKEYLGMMTSTE